MNKKVLIIIFSLIICFGFNSNVQAESTAVCKYDRYIVVVRDHDIGVSFDVNTRYVSIKNNLTATNFTKSDGTIECVDVIYVKLGQQGRTQIQYIYPTYVKNALEYKLTDSAVKNDSQPQEEVLLKCSYGNSVIIKTSSGLKYQFPSLERDNHVSYNIQPNEIGNSCPSEIYAVCARGYCGISLNKSNSPSELVFKNSQLIDKDKLDEVKSKFQNMIYDLQPYMNTLAKVKHININNKLAIIINNKKKYFSWNKDDNSLVDDFDIEYRTKAKMTEIGKYCREILTINTQYYEARKTECDQFFEMYKEAKSLGLFSDLDSGCSVISNDLYAKLKWVLDIIKIVGPILALGFGTLDFVKAIASGDADKEMKTAFKRFSNRIIAAVTLFILPIILAFIMDIFLNNQDGYDSDNPFCGLVDFK